MDTQTGSLDLRVRGEEGSIQPAVVVRVVQMLQAILERAGVQGRWVYLITGPSDVLKQSRYHMRVQLASVTSPTMMHIVMRASHLPKGVVSGMLCLPSGIVRETFIKTLEPIVVSLNESAWDKVLSPEAREGMFDVGRPQNPRPKKGVKIREARMEPIPGTPSLVRVTALSPKLDLSTPAPVEVTVSPLVPEVPERRKRKVVLNDRLKRQPLPLLTRKLQAVEQRIRIFVQRERRLLVRALREQTQALATFDKRYKQYLKPPNEQ